MVTVQSSKEPGGTKPPPLAEMRLGNMTITTQYIPEKNIKILHKSYTLVDTGYSSPCWLWNKALNENGYAQFWFKDNGKGKSKNHRGHRATYRHFIGEIPEGLDLDHLCQVEACVNPYHLEAVTPLINQQRKWEVIYSLKVKVTIHKKGGE